MDNQKIDSYIPALQEIHDGLKKLGATNFSVKDMYEFIKSGGSMAPISHLIDPRVLSDIRMHILVSRSSISEGHNRVKIASEVGSLARRFPNGMNPNHYTIDSGLVKVCETVKK